MISRSLKVPGSDSSALADHVVGPVLVIHESPLHAGRESGAAATAQAGSFNDFDHLFRLHAR